MNMKKSLLIMSIAVLLFSLLSCSKLQNNEVTQKTSNTLVDQTNTSKPASQSESSTPTATLAAFYEGMRKKDDTAIRKTFSNAAISEYDKALKQSNSTSLVEFFESQNPTPEKVYESRSEVIDGDTATLEVRDQKRSMWVKIKYVKEDGIWKIAAPSETLKLNPELSAILDKEAEEKAKTATKNAKTTTSNTNVGVSEGKK